MFGRFMLLKAFLAVVLLLVVAHVSLKSHSARLEKDLHRLRDIHCRSVINTKHPQLSPLEPEGVWKVPLVYWVRKIQETRRKMHEVPTSCTGLFVPLFVALITVTLVTGLGCGLLVRRLWKLSEEEHNNKLRNKYKSVKSRLYEPCRRSKLYRTKAQSDSELWTSEESSATSTSSSSPDKKRKKRKKQKGKKRHGKKRRH
ncbi:hypothetical protein Hamer_G009241 [Homarus americanus]|uniref:Uncharacterized protein n=1 Tax=Homarus americanus TaxID=6706 RepID=A0A8J5NB86_HOMAM|nr:hypothetical protein Hamer_G009241 [Homarus americanus]